MPQRSAAIHLGLDKLADAHADQLSVAVTLASGQLGPVRDTTPSSPTAALTVRVTCGVRDAGLRQPPASVCRMVTASLEPALGTRRRRLGVGPAWSHQVSTDRSVPGV